MKKKILNVFQVFLLIMLSLTLSLPAFAWSVLYAIDFTVFTEYDPAGRLTVTSDTITINDLDYDENASVYWDYGTDYFNGQNIEVQYTVNTPSSTGSYNNWGSAWFTPSYPQNGWVYIVGHVQSGGVKNYKTTTSQLGAAIHYRDSTGEHNSGVINYGVGYLDTDVYFTFKYNYDYGTYGRYELYIYSDSNRTSLIGSTTTSPLTSRPSFRYFCAMTASNTGGSGYVIDASVSDMEITDNNGILAVTTIEGVDIEYVPEAQEYKIYCQASLIGDAFVWMEYSLDQIDYDLTSLTDWDEDGTYEGYFYIPYSEEGNTVYYRAYALGDSGSDTGTEYSFTLERDDLTEPLIILDQEDIGIDTKSYSGQNVPIAWTLTDDGGETCNVTIAYNTLIDYITYGNWLYTGNTTADIFDNGYGYVNMTEDTWYITHAMATNSVGSSNSTDLYFVWYDATMPEVFTLPPSDFAIYTMPDGTHYVQVDFNALILDDGGADCLLGFETRQVGTTEWNQWLYDTEWHNETENFTKTWFGFAPAKTYEYRALITNEFLYNPITWQYTWEVGNTVSFITPSSVTEGITSASVYLNDVDWWDDTTVICDITLISDGGYECNVSMQYRENTISGVWTDSGHGVHGVTTGQDIETYIDGLTYGVGYQFRAKATPQVVGGVPVYSNIITFQLRSPTDTTTPDSGDDITNVIDEKLIEYGMYNTGGKLLVVIGACILVFIIIVFITGKQWKEHVSVTIPIAGLIDVLIVILGMIKGYVPVPVTIVLLIVFAGLVAGFVLKQFGAKQGGVA